MPLQKLPNELVLMAAAHLDVKSLNAFLRTSWRFATLLTPILHDIASHDFMGTPSLVLAVQGGYETLVRLLLKKGVDVDCMAYRFEDPRRPLVNSSTPPSPIQDACKLGYESIAKLLLENGADVSVFSNIHGTLLHLAVDSKSENIVKLLLKHGMGTSDISITSLYRPSVLRAAVLNVSKENLAIVRLLSPLAAPSVRNDACRHAIDVQNREALMFMLKEDVDINLTSGYDGTTLLHQAAGKGELEIVKLLLELGANIMVRDIWGDTALLRAKRSKHMYIVETLLAFEG